MWNKERYEEVKKQCKNSIEKGTKKPYDWMIEYKDMIKKEDYEGAKAVTEILKPLNYETKDTHAHIKELWQ